MIRTCVLDADGNSRHVRPEVAEFALALETKLRKNDHKTDWHDQPVEAHIQLLKIELMEFEVAKEFFGISEMCGELLDIAAFALIIRDKLRKGGLVTDTQGIITPGDKEL